MLRTALVLVLVFAATAATACKSLATSQTSRVEAINMIRAAVAPVPREFPQQHPCYHETTRLHAEALDLMYDLGTPGDRLFGLASRVDEILEQARGVRARCQHDEDRKRGVGASASWVY